MGRVLIACEESQALTKCFRELGHDAFSCDLKPCSGGKEIWHLQQDVFEVIDQGWDLMIAHPPCTFLAGSSVQWLSHPEDRHLPFNQRRVNPKYPNRRADMLTSLNFVKALYTAPIKHVVIENPVGLLSTLWMKPSQIIQPYMFGDEATKTTCLWLRNLPRLEATRMVGKGERTVFSSGKSHPKWYANIKNMSITPEERRALRSKTFPGIAMAMAQQWGSVIE